MGMINLGIQNKLVESQDKEDLLKKKLRAEKVRSALGGVSPLATSQQRAINALQTQQRGLTAKDALISAGSAGAGVGAKLLAKKATEEVGKEVAKETGKEAIKSGASTALSSAKDAGISLAGKFAGDLLDEGGSTTDTGKGLAGGAVKGAAQGAAFGGVGAAVGAGVGALVGALKARSARKKALGDIEAKKQAALSQIHGTRTANINAALANLGAQFSRSLIR